jgi:hypothetical protein
MDAASSLSPPSTTLRLNWRVTPLRLTAALIGLTFAVRLTGLTSRPWCC